MTRQEFVTKAVKFVDSMFIPPEVEVDHEKIQQWINEAWKIAIKSHPKTTIPKH